MHSSIDIIGKSNNQESISVWFANEVNTDKAQSKGGDASKPGNARIADQQWNIV